jgi:radical SAM superfamily enzyme YgiQ (UPF0313 family)
LNITIASTTSILSCDGSLLISSLLKEAGHKVTDIYLSRSTPFVYETDELQQLGEILQGTDIVLISVYSHYLLRAIQLSQFIHDNYKNLKVIWGGPHCISSPEDSLQYADGVCFSEGDIVVVELMNKIESGKDYLNTQNMAFNNNGSIIKNNVLPQFDDLDSLPYFDMDLDNKFFLDGKPIKMTKDIYREKCKAYPYYDIPILFYTTSRGCPHKCTYCGNSRYFTLFGNKPHIMFYSVDRIIEELTHILFTNDFFEFICFGDDDFLLRPQKDIEKFAIKYKHIGLPFGIAFSANTYKKEKIEILLDNGLQFVQMGVQSGSSYIVEKVYNRNIKVAKTRKVASQLSDYKKTYGIDILLDFIIDNPYETKHDVYQTYKYLIKMPRNINFNLFFLTFLKGSKLYERALNDGFIDENEFRYFFKGSVTYQNNYEMFLLLFLFHLKNNHPKLLDKIPRFIFQISGSNIFRTFSSFLPKSFYKKIIERVQRKNKKPRQLHHKK